LLSTKIDTRCVRAEYRWWQLDRSREQSEKWQYHQQK